jgi:hypothetical protein
VKAARSNRRAIRIVSQCATAEEFVAAFHSYLERDSLFIATGSPEEPGQAVRFVMTLAGGETVLRGAGRVVETHRDRANFYGLRGMKLQFDELDDGSRRALAALESRAGGPKTRGAQGQVAPATADVIECLIYDDPETESADPAAAEGGRRRGARPQAERGLPLGDDDVTAVSQAPPRSPRSSGTGPQPHQGGPRATGAVPVAVAHQNTPMPPVAHPGTVPPGAMSFIVPRPRPDEGGAVVEGSPEGLPSVMSGAIELADMPTDMLPAMRPRAPGPPIMPQPGVVRMAHTPAHGLPSGSVPPHMMPPDPAGFTPPEFTMPPTRPGVRRGIPRPPMPAERTELVRIHRPSYVRTAAVSATLGALLGLGAGYLLWGMDHAALRSRMAPPAEKAEDADKADPAARPDDRAPASKPDQRAIADDGKGASESAAAPAASGPADAGPDEKPDQQAGKAEKLAPTRSVRRRPP